MTEALVYGRRKELIEVLLTLEAIGTAGGAITMSLDIGFGDLETAGVFRARDGTARHLRRYELPADWNAVDAAPREDVLPLETPADGKRPCGTNA